MKVTSAEANKLLRKVGEEIRMLQDEEDRNSRFVAAVGEDAEELRPDYDFAATRIKLAALHEKQRKIKHAISLFNIAAVVPGFDMTVDQVLIRIPQLNEEKHRMGRYAACRQKTRRAVTGNVIDYEYANYSVEEAKKEYDRISDLLSSLQNALDQLNSTVTFELDI